MKKRGKGLACFMYGIGNTGASNPAAAFVEILQDGRVQVLAGAADIGQGSNTVLAQIAAEVIGVQLEDVKVISADTGVTPYGGSTSASRQTYASGNAVRLAAEQAKEAVLNVAARILNVRKEFLVCQDRKVFCVSQPDRYLTMEQAAGACYQQGILPVGSGYFNPPFMPLDPETGLGVPFKTYTFGAQVVEVEVDTETGEVSVINVWAAYDVGQVINLHGAQGQVEGGIVMGIGQASMEQVVTENGRVLSDSLTTYVLPTVMDIPQIAVEFVNEPEPSGPFGAKGLGEPALVPTAAAVANAVADAIGSPIESLPITPEKILKTLQDQARRTEGLTQRKRDNSIIPDNRCMEMRNAPE